MNFYQPASFRAAANVGRKLAADFPFATLITPQAQGMPWISHLPLLADAGQPDCLFGHLARANGHLAALLQAPSIAIFHGQHGYISPRWYATPGMVPTWNYRVAHAHVHATAVSADALPALLQDLSRAFDDDWRTTQVPPAALAAMHGAIGGFHLHVEQWQVKEKLSQNRLPQDRAALAAALDGGDAAAQQLAASMRALDG